MMEYQKETISLPPPITKGKISLEETLIKQRSVRDYQESALSLVQLSQILWAGQGTTGGGWLRAAPSAGATYPLELFIVTGPRGIEGLPAGIYRYHVHRHELVMEKPGDFREPLADAGLSQGFIAEAPVNIVIGAEFSRTEECYGKRGERYVHLEAGHTAQNIHLQCVTLGLGSAPVAAFNDAKVQKVIGMGENVRPLYIIPVGKPR